MCWNESRIWEEGRLWLWLSVPEGWEQGMQAKPCLWSALWPWWLRCIFTLPTEENTTFWTNSVLIQMKHKALWTGLFLKYKLKIILLNHTRNIHMCMQIYSCIYMYRLIYLHEYINTPFMVPGFDLSIGEDPLEEGTATHSSILAWRILKTEEPGRLHSIGSQRVGHNWSNLAHINLF